MGSDQVPLPPERPALDILQELLQVSVTPSRRRGDEVTDEDRREGVGALGKLQTHRNIRTSQALAQTQTFSRLCLDGAEAALEVSGAVVK